MRKNIFKLGAILTTSLPIFVAISCGKSAGQEDGSKESVNSKDTTFSYDIGANNLSITLNGPITLNQLKKQIEASSFDANKVPLVDHIIVTESLSGYSKMLILPTSNSGNPRAILNTIDDLVKYVYDQVASATEVELSKLAI